MPDLPRVLLRERKRVRTDRTVRHLLLLEINGDSSSSAWRHAVGAGGCQARHVVGWFERPRIGLILLAASASDGSACRAKDRMRGELVKGAPTRWPAPSASTCIRAARRP